MNNGHNSCDSGISVLNYCHSWDNKSVTLTYPTLDSSLTYLPLMFRSVFFPFCFSPTNPRSLVTNCVMFDGDPGYKIGPEILGPSPKKQESWRKGYARQRRHSKMAVSRQIGFYRTANSAVRSADPEKRSPEANMEWVGCSALTVCEIFALKYYCDLVVGGHSRSSKVAPFDRAHTTLYSSTIVTMPLSITVSEI